MTTDVLIAVVGAISAATGAMMGVVGSWLQQRAQRQERVWEKAGDVRRSSAETLWDAANEFSRQLLAFNQNLMARFDSLVSSVAALTERTEDLVEKVEQLIKEHLATREEIRRLNGGDH